MHAKETKCKIPYTVDGTLKSHAIKQQQFSTPAQVLNMLLKHRKKSAQNIFTYTNTAIH
jgi:hypothetical protein